MRLSWNSDVTQNSMVVSSIQFTSNKSYLFFCTDKIKRGVEFHNETPNWYGGRLGSEERRVLPYIPLSEIGCKQDTAGYLTFHRIPISAVSETVLELLHRTGVSLLHLLMVRGVDAREMLEYGVVWCWALYTAVFVGTVIIF